MAENDKTLPEGTDSIIAGASGTGGGRDSAVTTSATLIIEEEVAVPSGGQDGSAAGGSSSSSSGDSGGASGTAGASSGDSSAMFGRSDQPIGRRLRQGSEKLTGQATDKARGFVTQGLERSSEALANVSRMIGETAPGIDERLGQEYGDYARRAAGAIEEAASGLAAKDPEELIEDTRNFVRKSPGVALAGAAVIGFALARLVKSGLAPNRNRSDRNE